MLKSQSIKRKLTLLTLVVGMTSLILGTIATVIQEFRSFRTNAVNELSAQARMLAGLSTAALSFNDTTTATEMLSELKNRSHLHIGAIYQEGRLFARYERLGSGDSAPEIQPNLDGHRFSPEHLELITPIVFKGERLGAIYLAADTRELHGRLWQNLLVLATVFITSTLLALALAARIQKAIIDPIHSLSRTAAEVASSQNYSLRAVKLSEDELGRLTEVFNQMLERIQHQDRDLKESQERYEVAVQGSSDGLWDLDLRRLTAYYSPRCRSMLGYPEPTGPSDQEAWRALTHPEDCARVDEVFVECWSGNRLTLETEFRARAHDGTYRWILARGAVLRDNNGLCLRIAGSHTDITERKRSEAALLESESRFRSLIQSASEGIVQADPDERIASWNLGAQAVFRCSAEEILGQPLDSLIAETDRPGFKEHTQRCRQGSLDAADRTIECTGLRRDGSPVSIEVSVFSWKVDSRTYLGAIVRDITERKRAAQELEQLNRRLLDASRQAGMAEIATGVLHNVGNVLNSVNVSATLVGDRFRQSRLGNLIKAVSLLRENEADLGHYVQSDPKGRMVLGYISSLIQHLQEENQANIRELASLTGNVDHIKQIVAMQQSYARVAGVLETLPPRDLAEDALRIVANAYARSGIQIVREFQDCPRVCVDKHKVLQVLVNLLTNARQSMDEAGPAEKRAVVRIQPREDDPSRVEIIVRDNGLGIATDNLTRIFQHGFTTKKDGHGFGLHSGANALKETGGSLTVHSDGHGHGATFTVTLPTQAEASQKEAA